MLQQGTFTVCVPVGELTHPACVVHRAVFPSNMGDLTAGGTARQGGTHPWMVTIWAGSTAGVNGTGRMVEQGGGLGHQSGVPHRNSHTMVRMVYAYA